MKLFTKTILLIIFISGLAIGQSVVVNEFSQGPSGSKEWLEILIINNSVNLNGSKIKDGNSAYRLIFKDNPLWNNVSSGSIIVVYNGGDKDSVNLPENDYSFSGDYKVVVPHNDTLFFSTSGTGGWPGGWFNNTLNTDNPAILNDSETTIWDWNVHGPGTSIRPGSNQVSSFFSNSVNGMVTPGNWNRSAASSGTAGLGNNPVNIAWINSLRGTLPNTTVQFASANQTVNENVGTVTINVSISNPNPSAATTVQVALAGGTATSGSDYNPYSTQTLTFPAGSSASQSFTITIIDDNEIESDETIIFTLQNPSGGTNAGLGTPSTFTLTIDDNDTPIPLLTIAEAAADINGDLIPDKLGQVVKIRGVVIGPNFQTVNFSYYIQQGNAGINIFRSGATLPLLQLGDSVEVTGTIGQFRGLTQISHSNDAGLIKLGTGTLPKALALTIDEYTGNPELYESILIKFSNVFKASGTWPSAGQSATLRIFHGTDTTDLRIDSDTDIDDNPEPTWPRNITGIGSQYTSSTSVLDDGYQLLPRYYSDFEPATSIGDEDNVIPDKIVLHNNYPNPFNPSTHISFSLPEMQRIKLSIYNILGELISIAAEGLYTAGKHSVQFKANDLGSGIYFYKLETEKEVFTKKMLLMK